LDIAQLLVSQVDVGEEIGFRRRWRRLRVGDRLAASGADITYHDPYVASAEIGGRVHESTSLTDEVLRDSDLVVVLTDHPDIDYARVVEVASCTYDTRGVTEDLRPEAGRLHRA
jgi:UDP-N-acetyl-D-glucosamine dehydrogenase